MRYCDWDFTSDIWVFKRSFIWGHFISFFIYLCLFQFILLGSNNKGLKAIFLPNPTHTQTQRSCLSPQLWGKRHLGSCLSNVDIVLTILTKSLNIAPLCEFATLCTRQPLHSQRLNMQTLINLYCFLLFVLLLSFFSFGWWSTESVSTRRAHASSRTLCLICQQTHLIRIDVHRVCAKRERI